MGQGQRRIPDDLLKSSHELKEETNTDNKIKQLTPTKPTRPRGVPALLLLDEALALEQDGARLLGGPGEGCEHATHRLVRLAEAVGPLLNLGALLLQEGRGFESGERGLLGCARAAPRQGLGALFGTGIPKLQLQHGPGVITPTAGAQGKGQGNDRLRRELAQGS